MFGSKLKTILMRSSAIASSLLLIAPSQAADSRFGGVAADANQSTAGAVSVGIVPFGGKLGLGIYDPVSKVYRSVPVAPAEMPPFTGGDVLCAGGSVVCTSPTKLYHVANAAALSTWTNYTSTVFRDDVGIPYAYTAAACSNPDGGVQITAPSGGCQIANLRGMAAVPTDVWGSVADSNGTSGNGTDDTAAEQAAINWAVLTGRRIYRAANGNGLMRRITAPLTVTGHITMGGDYCAPYNTGNGLFLPGPGSTLFFDHAGRGIVFGSNTSITAEGMVLEDTCIYRAQPTPPANGANSTAGGSWTPAANDYDIVEQQDDLLLRHVMFVDSTKGTLQLSGRLRVDGYEGQFFQNGIKITSALDTPNIQNVHMWPYGNVGTNQAINNYSLVNLDALYLLRADNMFISNFFSILSNHCIRIGQYTGGTSATNGTVNKGRAVNVDCDGYGGAAIASDTNVSGGTLTLVNFTAQGFGGSNGPAGSIGNNAVDLEGTGTAIKASIFRSTLSQSEAVKLGGTSNGFTSYDTLLETTWQAGTPSGAITSSSSTNVVYTTGPINSSGGASTFSGTGTFQGSLLQGESIIGPANNGAGANFPVADGLLTIADNVNGNTAVYIVGGGFVTLLGQNAGSEFAANVAAPTSNQVSVNWNSSIGSYVLLNGASGAKAFSYSYSAPPRSAN